MTHALLTTRAGAPFDCDAVPRCAIDSLFAAVTDCTSAKQMRIAAMFGLRAGDKTEIWIVLADDRNGALHVGCSEVGAEFPSLTPACPQAHLFEREIAEQFGVVPLGHPWLKPLRFPSVGGGQPGVCDFYRVEGDEVHEVAVGPVHAGVIEPGHFRFQCFGEEVLNLEIALGYQHRGIEATLASGAGRRMAHYMETAAGDTTIAHVLAWAASVEASAGTVVPARAQAIRAIALELERLANHTGDLGALAGDVGFLPTANFCGRLRGEFLNLTALICGNRFGRNLVRPGGVVFDLDPSRTRDLLGRLASAEKDVTGAVNLLFETPSVLERFEETGALSLKRCRELGLVGPAARACGADIDVRRDHPSGFYQFQQVPVSVAESGDVMARAMVRRLEIQRSIAFIKELAGNLPSGSLRATGGASHPDRSVVTLVEGWRGEVCHVHLGGPDPARRRYKMVDPSFHNWMGLAVAMRGQQISDFPLCNKSFNLSYCGHDL